MRNISVVQELMMNSLIRLMHQETFSDITITQLTQEARVARKTYYLNFDSKEEILRLYIKCLSDELVLYLSKYKVITMERLANGFFLFWKEREDFVENLVKNHLFTMLIDEFEIFIVTTVANMFTIDTEVYTPPKNEYVHMYHAAGLWKLLEQWIKKGMVETPAEMTKIFMEIILFNHEDRYNIEFETNTCSIE